MVKITDGWFQLEFDPNGYTASLSMRWMRRHGEGPIYLKETFGFFFLGDKTYISPEVLKDDHAPALKDIVKQSRAVNAIIEERKQNGKEQVHVLPEPSNHTSTNSSTIQHEVGNLIITRTIKPHPVHPIPVVEHKVVNLGNSPISVNYYWSMGAPDGCYQVLSEKGDMVPQVMRALGNQSSLYFTKTPHSVADRSKSKWAYLNLNFGEVGPGETRVFLTKLWCIQHLWIGTQFSGLAYLLSDRDPIAAIAAMAVTPGRKADAVCSILERYYSPIFVVQDTGIPSNIKDILQKSPTRKLLTNIKLERDSLKFCSENNIEAVYLPDFHTDPYVAAQRVVDKLLGFETKPTTFVNVLPASPDRQLLLSYYHSLRREASSIGPFTAPVRNTFVLASTIESNKYEWEPSQRYARILGTEDEIPEKVEHQVGRQVKVKRYEYSPEENAFSSLLTFFIYHDYVLPRLACETMFDEHNPVMLEFAKQIERATGTQGFWDVPQELILEYGKTEIYGPPFSVIIPSASSDHRAIFNAAIGAQYAKAIFACLHPLRQINVQAREKVNKHLEALGQAVYHSTESPPNRSAMKESFKAISDALCSGFNIFSQILLGMGDYGGRARANCGRLGIYLFLSDYSLPIELISSPDNFGRIRSISSLTPCGRMSFPDPFNTGCFVVNSVLNHHDMPPTGEILIASNPTGDLIGTTIEESGICIELCRSGLKPRLLTGAHRKILGPDDKLIQFKMGIGERLPYTVVEATKTKNGEVQDESKYELGPVLDCSVENFIQAVSACTGLHYTGHGILDKGIPALVLSNGNLQLDKFPHLAGRPWILMNACEVGQVGGEMLSQSAMVLIEHGARYVVAPLMAISDFGSIHYISAYSGGLPLFLPIALSFHASRHDKYLAEDELTDHLAYVIYGDPFSPQGDELWEIFEAMMCTFMGDQEAQKSTKETLHFYEREVYLYKIINDEFRSYRRFPNRELKEETNQWFAGKLDVSRGFLFGLIADTLLSGEDRLERLDQAAKSFLNAALKMASQKFNMQLMSGYGFYRKAQYQFEAASLRFLQKRSDLKSTQQEFLQAVDSLQIALSNFDKIGAVSDADECRKLIEQLKKAINIKSAFWNRGETTNFIQSLLREPKALV